MHRKGTAVNYLFIFFLLFFINCSFNLKPQVTKLNVLPAGTLVLKFSRNIKGPIDLSIDGVRIKVDQTNKGGNMLTISGLEATSHRYTLSSPNDAFGPSSAEVVLPDDQGIVIPVFTQSFDSILYGTTKSNATADNPKNIKAILNKQ